MPSRKAQNLLISWPIAVKGVAAGRHRDDLLGISG